MLLDLCGIFCEMQKLLWKESWKDKQELGKKKQCEKLVPGLTRGICSSGPFEQNYWCCQGVKFISGGVGGEKG